MLQSEVVGLSLFDFVHFEDAPNLRRSLEDSHAKLLPNHSESTDDTINLTTERNLKYRMCQMVTILSCEMFTEDCTWY